MVQELFGAVSRAWSDDWCNTFMENFLGFSTHKVKIWTKKVIPSRPSEPETISHSTNYSFLPMNKGRERVKGTGKSHTEVYHNGEKVFDLPIMSIPA